MARKRATKKATRGKAVRKAVAPKRSAAVRRGQVIRVGSIIKVGCKNSACDSDSDGRHIGGAGSKVLMCAQNNDVDVQFKRLVPGNPSVLDSPFAGPNPFTIAMGTCQLLTVKGNVTNATYEYHLTCRNPGCGNLANDPSMIVP